MSEDRERNNGFSMNLVVVFVLGVALGAGGGVLLANRYAPVHMGAVTGRLDKLTGKECLFLGAEAVSNEILLRNYGIEKCSGSGNEQTPWEYYKSHALPRSK